MLDCNAMSDGILVLCADSKFHIFMILLRTYLLVSILYSIFDLISVLGLAGNVFGRKGGRENDQKDYNFADRCSDIDHECFTNDLHQLVLVFQTAPFSDKDYSYGIVFGDSG